MASTNQGPQGPQGPQGAFGVGVQGAPGTPGAAGPQGPAGPGLAIGGAHTNVQVNWGGALYGNGAFTFDAGVGNVYGYSFAGRYYWAGAYTGALDFRVSQTYGVGVGSNITSMTAIAGQICRILVSGNGAITVAGVKWAQGSPAWGTTFTIVSLFTDGGSFWASTLPFST